MTQVLSRRMSLVVRGARCGTLESARAGQPRSACWRLVDIDLQESLRPKIARPGRDLTPHDQHQAGCWPPDRSARHSRRALRTCCGRHRDRNRIKVYHIISWLPVRPVAAKADMIRAETPLLASGVRGQRPQAAPHPGVTLSPCCPRDDIGAKMASNELEGVTGAIGHYVRTRHKPHGANKRRQGNSGQCHPTPPLHHRPSTEDRPHVPSATASSITRTLPMK